MQQNKEPGGCGAVALIVVGLVVLIPSGLCTGALALIPLWQALMDPRAGAYLFGGMPIVLIFGGPFVVGGAAMVWAGVSRLRRDRQNGNSGDPPA